MQRHIHPSELIADIRTISRQWLFTTLLFLIGILIAYWILSFQKKSSLALVLSQTEEHNKVVLNACTNNIRRITDSYYHSYANTPDTKKSLAATTGGAKGDIALARSELSLLHTESYERMVGTGITLMNFLNPDGEDILRMHRPESFGDNLQSHSRLLQQAREQLTQTWGFEIGRTMAAYRYIYPLLDHEGQHIGTISLGASIQEVHTQMNLLDPHSHYDTLLRLPVLDKHLSPDELKKFTPWEAMADYYYYPTPSDDLPYTAQNRQIRTKIESYLRHLPGFVIQLRQGRSFALDVPVLGNHYAVIFNPVFDADKQLAAYFFSYRLSPELSAIHKDFLNLLYVSCAILAALCWAIAKKTEQGEQLRLEKNRLTSITNTMGEGLYVIDKSGMVTDVNEAACRLLGYPREELIGKNAHALFHHLAHTPAGPVDECPIYKTISSGKSYHGTETFCTSDNTMIPVQVHSQALISGSQLVGAVTTFDDITDIQVASKQLRDAKEAADAANRAKSVFLATMSHEIRTPLNSVIGMSSLLADSELSPSQKSMLSIVQTSGEALLHLINDILDYSKIEAGKLDLERVVFCPAEVLENSLEITSLKAASKKLTLTYFMDESVPAAVLGDKIRLRQILLNLLSNAIKFTEHGSIHISLHYDTSDGKGMLHWSVTDTGIGIDSETLGLLFTPFTQGGTHISRKYGGTGLGLSISKKIAESMGGSIVVRSAPGHGSNFSFRVHAEPHGGIQSVYDQGAHPALAEKRLLVIEQCPHLRRVLSLQAKYWNMVVHLHDDASDMHDPRAFYDAILADSTSLSRHAEWLNRDDCPVILLQTHGQTTDLLTAASHRIETLSKPLLLSALKDKLLQLFDPSPTGPKTPSQPSSHDLPPDLRILVAEDIPTNQTLVRLLLEKCGYTPTIVENGREALDLLEKKPYDILFMDMQMPVLDGIQTTALIRQNQNPAIRHLFIVALTANATREDRDKCLQAGMNDFLMKPIKLSQIEDCIRRTSGIQRFSQARTTEIPPPIFDGSNLSDTLDGMPPDHAIKLLQEISSSWKANGNETIAAYKNTAANRSSQKVFEQMHKLKGGCNNFGFLRMAKICSRWADEARSGKFDAWEEAGHMLDSHWKDAWELFDDYIKQRIGKF